MVTQRVIPVLTPGQRVAMSYEDYLALVDEGRHTEWVNGEVIVFMPPSDRHQDVQLWLARLVAFFADLGDLGSVRVAPHEMFIRPGAPARQPDILFVARAHLARLEPLRLNGPADLIVEIISPESVRRDCVEKLREYAMAGVPEYWLIDSRPSPAPPAWYHLNVSGEYEPIAPDAAGHLHSVMLPGFWLDPAWLVEEPLPKPLAVIQLIAPQALRRALDTGE